ncbi:carrier with solute carrier repeats [Schizosaccharomyces japonicus yFS275]|uniref:Carrier with solute carrier repeats n=1 Tax=Schizosaccharomyces japonicus (strain yFS275 / FY16936) TaxID=402676 RepID=B6JW56_SCHJY|nr:carrier with solute carrier repeats [Schizosaccharomyces japonicus yFS275]EEB05607.2 carrier with solute carrier repeats [Schizosaccharomyces japonicus yFS275]
MSESNISQSAKDFVAGAAGGVAQVLAGQPFDCVKVRLQSQAAGAPEYTNAVDCVQKIIKNEGLQAFYKGTVMPLLGIGLCISTQFTAFESGKRFFYARNGTDELTFGQYYMAGAFSGAVNSVLVSPIEHIRIRLQVQTGPNPLYKGPVDCMRKIASQHGFKGIMKGLFPTVLRETHGVGMYFLAYELLLAQAIKARGYTSRSEVPGWRLCLYGAAAGYAMWISAYMFDVVKSNIQTDAFGSGAKYSTSWKCAQSIFRTAGFSGFWRGFVPVLARAAPVNAITFYVYETVAHKLRDV